ncbi:COMM domain-containing protein 10-like [Tubulanus polymorphus]|uniref:COMM domain-containing protein 10-like n=1 Tax=Tubulanus polymorphus TaxID=672921 RepID=UPI003DA231EB
MSLFTATSSIKKAVSLINGLHDGKFPLLLTRILQKLHEREERSFSEEEEEKLESALGLTSQELELVLTTLEFFLQQAAYHTAKPAVLTQQLQQIELDESKVNVIVEAWMNSARNVVDQLRQRSISKKQLDGVKWRSHIQMSQASRGKTKLPVALFELLIKDEEKQDKEHIRMEFTHSELYAFYTQLEQIQSEIDHLS